MLQVLMFERIQGWHKAALTVTWMLVTTIFWRAVYLLKLADDVVLCVKVCSLPITVFIIII